MNSGCASEAGVIDSPRPRHQRSTVLNRYIPIVNDNNSVKYLYTYNRKMRENYNNNNNTI